MDARNRVDDVTVERDSGVRLVFGDGVTAEFNLVELRLHCPCAGCRADRERGLEPWPKPGSPIPLRIADASLVGAWGISLTWNDGHATGIYPWEYLLAICPCERCTGERSEESPWRK